MAKRIKGKRWFKIIAPEAFGEKEIGRTMASDPESLIDRRVVMSLPDLTDDFSKYYLKARFRVEEVRGDKALTKFDGLVCLRDHISRMVMRWTRRVDAIQDLRTKDDVKIRVKSIAIIPKRVKSSIKKAVRDKIKEMVSEHVESSTLEEFVNDVLSDKLKDRVLKEARRVYPVRKFEIRKVEVL